jgi:DNA-binding CsgD family transcriptional regulator
VNASTQASIGDFDVDGARYRFVAVSLAEGPEGLVALTDAEKDVAWRAARGDRTRAIAAARGSARRTVEHQLLSVFRKLAVASRAELACTYFQREGAIRERA